MSPVRAANRASAVRSTGIFPLHALCRHRMISVLPLIQPCSFAPGARAARFVAGAPQQASIAATVATLLIGQMVEGAQCIHDLFIRDRPLAGRSAAQCWSRLERTGVGGPGRQNGALFVEGEIGVADDVGRVFERLGWVQEIA
jgi:hypothetical protein